MGQRWDRGSDTCILGWVGVGVACFFSFVTMIPLRYDFGMIRPTCNRQREGSFLFFIFFSILFDIVLDVIWA